MCKSSTEKHKILGRRLNQTQGKNPKKKSGISISICKCSNCGLIYANPMPIPLNVQDHYDINPEEYWDTNYVNSDGAYYKNSIEKIKRLLNFSEGMKSLDIGAGLGAEMKAFSNAGFDAFGLEASKSFYNRAITHNGIDSKKLKMSMIEHAEFPDNFFDFILFDAVLEHIYSPSEAIKKALKWLKPGGIILVMVPSANWLFHKLVNLYYKIRLSDYVCNLSPMHEPYHLFEFTFKSFLLNSKILNYEVILQEYNICQSYMPKFLDPILKPIMKSTNTGMEISIWIKKNKN